MSSQRMGRAVSPTGVLSAVPTFAAADDVSGWRDAYAAICKTLAPVARLQPSSAAAKASPAVGGDAAGGAGASATPNPVRKLAPDLSSPGAGSVASAARSAASSAFASPPTAASEAADTEWDVGEMLLQGVSADSEAAHYVRAAITYIMTAYPVRSCWALIAATMAGAAAWRHAPQTAFPSAAPDSNSPCSASSVKRMCRLRCHRMGWVWWGRLRTC